MIRRELNTLKDYEEMLESMSTQEKEELREWMAQGYSVNCNPYLLYGENGCPMDLIDAIRINEDMCNNQEDYLRSFEDMPDDDLDDDIPF
jgi:DnaJ-domain-containing protein 1